VQPRFLGEQPKNLQGSRRHVIGPICTWDGFGFFSMKITVKQVQPPLVKMKKFGRTGQTSKEPFSRLEAGKNFRHCIPSRS